MTSNGKTRMERRKQSKKKQKTKKGQNKVWKKILLVIGILFLAIGIGIGGLFTYYIATAPPLDADKLTDLFSSKVYDMNGEIIADLGDIKRTKVEFDDLPQVLIDAVTATEDVRFFKHSGIDFRRLAGAIKANITGGFGSEGASTITHQVVENSFLTPDKKIKLKVQEQWLALKLERKYSKEQILEMYLNKIFYGSNAYGVAKAAEIYFGKTDLHDLTLVEAAMLAGLPQRPTAYNPYESPDLMKGRVDTVLKLMVRHGKISEAEANEAREVDISSLLAGKKPQATPYQAFIQQVRKEVEEKLDGADIHTDGLKIYTTLDTTIQDHVEFLLTDSDDNPIPYPDDEMQTGLTVLDTSNGAIRAIGGRRNSEGDQYNYAIQGKHQPGSTFKPITSYGPAIEYNKWSTYHQINDDKEYEVAGTTPIRNWNRRYQGWMSMRYALGQSLNVPTVKLLEETGLNNAKEFAEGLGIQFAKDSINIRDGIGGTETEVTPLQLAGAFRAFGNEGIYNEPYAVTKVEFPDGESVNLQPKPKAVMADYTAYMVTDMLKSVVTEGTGTGANIPGLPLAGKTGTTNLANKSGSPDSWFSGYTTNYAMAVWVGGYSDENGNRDVMPESGKAIPRILFKNIMTEISKNIETADFVKPDSVVEVAVEKGSNPAMLPSKYTPSSNIVTELFVKGHEPGKTSEKFDKLDPVSDLTAVYQENKNEIDITWKYASDEDVTFQVSSSINGGGMKELAITDDKLLTISDVVAGAEYKIQVIVESDKGSLKSEPASVTVKIAEEEEDMKSVGDLQASYHSDKDIITVSWTYDGPSAEFEVDVNGQKQNAKSNKMEISNVKQGQTYTITVTPIGTDGSNKGVRGDPKSVTESIPVKEEPVEPEEPENEPEEPETPEENDEQTNNENTNNTNANEASELNNDEVKEQES